MDVKRTGTCHSTAKSLTCDHGRVLYIVGASCKEKGRLLCECRAFCNPTQNVTESVRTLCRSRRSCSLSPITQQKPCKSEDRMFLTVDYRCDIQTTTTPATTATIPVDDGTFLVRTVNATGRVEATTAERSILGLPIDDGGFTSVTETLDRPNEITEVLAGHSTSLDPTILAVIVSAGVAALLLLLLLLVCLRRKHMNKPDSGRQAIEERPNELYEMGAASYEAAHAEEKHNELYNMDGGYASSDEVQNADPPRPERVDNIYTEADNNLPVAYVAADDVTTPV